MGKKVEIIDVTLDVNIADEIRAKVDSLSEEILEHTKEIVKKSGMKIQPVNKKLKERKAQLEKTALAVELLIKSFETPDEWLSGIDILEGIGVEATPQITNKLSMQIRRLLTKEGMWMLSKKRQGTKTAYRLNKLG